MKFSGCFSQKKKKEKIHSETVLMILVLFTLCLFVLVRKRVMLWRMSIEVSPTVKDKIGLIHILSWSQDSVFGLPRTFMTRRVMEGPWRPSATDFEDLPRCLRVFLRDDVSRSDIHVVEVGVKSDQWHLN